MLMYESWYVLPLVSSVYIIIKNENMRIFTYYFVNLKPLKLISPEAALQLVFSYYV